MTVHDLMSGSLGASRWPTVFSPLHLRGRMVQNRIVSTPHATGWGHGGLLTRAEVDYHVRKAAGGAGLIMTFGSASVDPFSAASYGSIALWDERNDELLAELARRVHEHGALIMSQMTHMGRRGNSLLSGVALKAASDLPEGVHREVPAVLTLEEIEVLVTHFGDAARRLMDLGWDGAEVTAHGGHLVEQFYDPYVNDRTDRYGGSLENRVRFGREALQAVRAATSEEFLVGFRMSAEQGLGVGGGMSVQDIEDVACAITADGAVDLLSIAGGSGYTTRSSATFVPGDELPENYNGAHAGRLRRATGVPVLVAGRILDAASAERVLTGDGVDLVAMTRAIIADPDLPRKSAAGITPRPCISHNQGCIGRLYSGQPMWCSVNPGIREPEVDLPFFDASTLTPREVTAPSEREPLVVVVGGGVAGAEAAYRSAQRGHRVVLFERSDRIGGRAEVAGRRRGRERWALYLGWLGEQLLSHHVDVRLTSEPTAADVVSLEPETVIIATGSTLRMPAWTQGAPLPVMDADELVTRPPQPPAPGARAVIIDDEGGFIAPTAAEKLVEVGWSVQIATSLPHVAAEVDATQVWWVRRRLKQAGVVLVDSVTPAHDGSTWALVDLESDQRYPMGAVDLIALAGVRRAHDVLSQELAQARPELRVVRIGDALAPRNLLDAAAEGARAGVGWAEPDLSVELPNLVSSG